jgi:hypothetical protein
MMILDILTARLMTSGSDVAKDDIAKFRKRVNQRIDALQKETNQVSVTWLQSSVEGFSSVVLTAILAKEKWTP